MGQGQSIDISPPWIPAPGKRYPSQIEQAIIDLAQSEEAFLTAASNDPPETEFVLDDHYDEIEAVVQFDNQLALQAEKLIPTKVTEQQFWSNYFSHVNAWRQQGDATIAAAAAQTEKVTAEECTPSPVNNESNPTELLDSADSAAEIENFISSYIKAAMVLPPLTNITSPIRFGIIGGISERMLQALSIKKASSVIGVIGSASPKNMKFKEFSNPTELITSPNVDAVYIGECSGDISCIELCRLVLQSGKHCLVDSYRTFCSAYALQRVDSQSQISALWPILSFSPRFSLIAELIEKNHLGSIGSIVYQFYIPRCELTEVLPSNCSPFEWSAAPVLEILDFIFGPLQHLQGYAKCSADSAGTVPYEGSVVFHFHIESGAIGSASFNFNSCVKEDRLLIIGSLGRISLPIFTEDIPNIEINDEAVAIPEKVFMDAEEMPTNEIRFVHSFIGGCESGRSSSFSQRQKRVGKLMDIILRSYYGDRHDYFWTRPETWEKVMV